MDRNIEPSPQLSDLLSLFPHKLVRPTQVAALEVIARMFAEGTRFTIVEAPTGAGKSALAFATARYAATLDDEDFESGAYILTPYNNLATKMKGRLQKPGPGRLERQKALHGKVSLHL